MENNTTTRRTLNILLVLAWIIFVGLCIETGGFLTNAVFVIFNPEAVGKLWHEADLSALLQRDNGLFFTMVAIMCLVTGMKAWMFYLIIMLLHNRKLNISQPFTTDIWRFASRLSLFALMIGLFSMTGVKYVKWLHIRDIQLPDIQYLRIGGADVWIFMSVILFVIAYIIKKGIALQNDNDLTI